MSAIQSNAAKPSGIPWLIIIAGSLIAVMTFGPRSAMGLFQLPLLQDKGWDRTTFSMAIALQNLFWGIGQPFFGAIADKYGTWRVLLMSAILYASGLVLMAWSTTPGMLYIGGGLLVGLGIASGSFGTILSAFARNVSAENRTFVFGIGTAAGSAGMFVFSPISLELIKHYGWSDALVYLGIAMAIVPLLAIPLRGNSSSGLISEAQYKQSMGEALREALGHRSYVLLTTGFFVCGFQLAFITAHFPAYLNDIGIDAKYAVLALALIGFFNVIGSLASGVISQRYSKPKFLAYLYIGRSVLVAAFLLLPQTGASVVVFAIVMGLMWLSTVPPTNALVAIMFGTRYLAMLGGIVFFSHQVGSFLGVWLGGYLYDHLGSYNPVWWLSVMLGILAAIVHWPIEERQADRPTLQPAE